MTSSPADAALDPMLCFALYSAHHRVGRIYRELLAPWSLSYTQFIVMLVLAREDGLTVGRLGGILGLDSGTLSPLLKRLESRGLLGRSRSTGDERVVTVSLTEDGSAVARELVDIPRCVGEQLHVTPVQADDLVRRLHDLTGS